ncbi:hypothetical protein ACFSTC_37275 [Nonomuraea ferruginea]
MERPVAATTGTRLPHGDPGQGGRVAAHADGGELHDQAERVVAGAQRAELGDDGLLLVQPAVRIGVDAHCPAHVGAEVFVGEYGTGHRGRADGAGNSAKHNLGHALQ